MMSPQEIAARIEAGLPGARAEVRDLTGTGDHFEAAVVAPDFAGKSLVERHQLVYALFPAELASGSLHAFSLKTKAPSEV
jgi:stress-induced morphogen